MIHSHYPKNISLILLSFLFLPLDTCILAIALLRSYISNSTQPKQNEEQTGPAKRKTVLVTGVGMTKGLVLARSFSNEGHRVIGADFDHFACGRLSKSLSIFEVLPKPNEKTGSSPYIQALLELIRREGVDLWVSCSAVASAVEDGEAKEIVEARTSCKAVQFDVATTQRLHEKNSFMAYCEEIGLRVPDTKTITSLDALKKALQNAPSGRKYILKPIGVDDANRGDMTLLPMPSWKETQEYISRLKISETASWILQQFIQGEEYCTHSVVIEGQVKVFVACPSAELLMHYEPLPNDSKLSRAMLDFTKRVAEHGGSKFTGHLSFDFMVKSSSNKTKDRTEEIELYPIECNPRAHTANVLFNDHPDMISAYLSLLKPDETKGLEDRTDNSVITPQNNNCYFWIGHDLVESVILPIIALITMQEGASATKMMASLRSFFSHLLFWKDGTFEWWDPAPWWMLYHVYWPMQFWRSLRTGKAWSRINVSTTKMFAC